MEEKFLGKITSAKYGMVYDMPFLFGLQLTFKLGDGSGVGTGSKYTFNISKKCRWEESERQAAITESIDFLHKILEDAKCNYVSELLDKPVEVIIEENTFKDFRVLTEVL